MTSVPLIYNREKQYIVLDRSSGHFTSLQAAAFIMIKPSDQILWDKKRVEYDL